MSGVILAPDGTKGRTQSNRRFVVCRAADTFATDEHGFFIRDADGGPVVDGRKVVIIKRSDSLVTARRARRYAGDFIWDQVKGELIR